MDLRNKSHNYFSKLLVLIGVFLLVNGLVLLSGRFNPVNEKALTVAPNSERAAAVPSHTPDKLKAVDQDFSIVIPKLGVNSKVFADVDPFTEGDYLQVLNKGVAQAKGSALPGQIGNIFIFSHSAATASIAAEYNAVFYQLGNLQVGDDVYLVYQGLDYHYQVTDKKIIDQTEVGYLHQELIGRTLTLLTCWPPGVSPKRLIVNAEETP